MALMGGSFYPRKLSTLQQQWAGLANFLFLPTINMDLHLDLLGLESVLKQMLNFLANCSQTSSINCIDPLVGAINSRSSAYMVTPMNIPPSVHQDPDPSADEWR